MEIRLVEQNDGAAVLTLQEKKIPLMLQGNILNAINGEGRAAKYEIVSVDKNEDETLATAIVREIQPNFLRTVRLVGGLGVSWFVIEYVLSFIWG